MHVHELAVCWSVVPAQERGRRPACAGRRLGGKLSLRGVELDAEACCSRVQGRLTQSDHGAQHQWWQPQRWEQRQQQEGVVGGLG